MEFNHVKYSLDIPDLKPFENCKLGREVFAENLTSLLKNSSDTSLTLALDGAWGMGKTTFLQMLKKHLVLNNIPTIYFSAWESDYTNEPLLAIIGEFNKQLAEQTAVTESKDFVEKISNIIVKASALLLPTLGKSFVSMVETKLGIGTAGREAVKEVMENTKSWGKELIKKYEENTQNVRKFKENLHEVVELLSGIERKPIVIIIDELDRCKPLYSIQVLEIVKHFFDIEGITFILSADYTQLKESIKHCYGAGFDADTYTHKFFDYYFTLDIKASPKMLVQNIFIQQWDDKGDDIRLIDFHVGFILDALNQINLSIRDIQQIAKMCKLIYNTGGHFLYEVFAEFIVYYIIEKHKNGNFYKLLTEISSQGYIETSKLEAITKSVRLSFERVHIEAYIEIFLYHNQTFEDRADSIKSNEEKLSILNKILYYDRLALKNRYRIYSNLMKVLSFLSYVQ